MIDHERVIKGLEYCTQHGRMCGRDCNGHWGWTDGSHTGMELLGEYRTKCPYGSCETGCVKTLAKDALALLKTQDPVEPIQDIVGDALFWVCGKCGHDIRNSGWYCANCGRAVKWE